MPSNRRIKIFGLLSFLSVVTLLFYTSSIRQSRTLDTRTASDFYSKTVNALNNDGGSSSGGGGGGGGTGGAQVKMGEDSATVKDKGDDGNEDEDDAGRRQRLNEAAKVAKGNANAKAPKPDPPSSIIGKGSAAEGSVAGRKTFPLKEGEGTAQKPVEEKVETPEEHEVEMELNSILKKSPIIIFSKSYCPHSKRAKSILLEKYTIDPAPYVVELDLHPLGLQLQASLADMTGRRTVPNVLINGRSIGGGDEVSGLDSQGTLIETVKSMGGKRMVKVEKKAAEAEKKAVEAEKGKEKKETADQHDSGLKRRRLIKKDSIL